MKQMSQQTNNCPPHYEADEGKISEAQLDQMKQSAPKLQGGTIRSSLFEQEHKAPPSILSQYP